jgi:hypothetical protein
MTDTLTPEQVDQIAQRVEDRTRPRLESPKSTRSPDSFLGRIAAEQEAAREQRRREMDGQNARRLAEAQADADDARHELAGLARKVAKRDVERQGVEREALALINKGRALLDRDQREHAEFDNRVQDLKARAAARPPRKEQRP